MIVSSHGKDIYIYDLTFKLVFLHIPQNETIYTILNVNYICSSVISWTKVVAKKGNLCHRNIFIV